MHPPQHKNSVKGRHQGLWSPLLGLGQVLDQELLLGLVMGQLPQLVACCASCMQHLVSTASASSVMLDQPFPEQLALQLLLLSSPQPSQAVLKLHHQALVLLHLLMLHLLCLQLLWRCQHLL